MNQNTSDLATAMTLVTKGKRKTAIKILRVLVEREPSNDGTWQQLGIAYRLVKKYGDAIHAFEKALQLTHGNHLRQGQIKRDLAMVYLKLNDEVTALAKLKESHTHLIQTKAEKEIGATIGFIGRAFWKLEKIPEAIERFQTADKMLEDHALYRLNNAIWWLKAERNPLAQDGKKISHIAMELASSGETRNRKRQLEIFLLRLPVLHGLATKATS